MCLHMWNEIVIFCVDEFSRVQQRVANCVQEIKKLSKYRAVGRVAD